MTWLPAGCCTRATGVVPQRATKVPGAWRWGFFSLRMRRLPDEWLKMKPDSPRCFTKNSNRSSKGVRETALPLGKQKTAILPGRSAGLQREGPI